MSESVEEEDAADGREPKASCVVTVESDAVRASPPCGVSAAVYVSPCPATVGQNKDEQIAVLKGRVQQLESVSGVLRAELDQARAELAVAASARRNSQVCIPCCCCFFLFFIILL